MNISTLVTIASLIVSILVISTTIANVFKWIGSERRFKELKTEMYKEIDKAEKRYNEQRNMLLALCIVLAIMLTMIFTIFLPKRKQL